MKLTSTFTHTFLVLCLGLSLFAQTGQQQAVPSGLPEFEAALRIPDVQARIKEIRRVKAAYPRFSETADIWLLPAESEVADTFDKLLAVQSEILKSNKSSYHGFDLIVIAANSLVNNPKVREFPKTEVLKAVQNYKEEGLRKRLPEYVAAMPESRRSELSDSGKLRFEVALARAQLINGDAKAALDTLEELKKAGRVDGTYYNALGEVYLDQKRDREAMDLFFTAIAESSSADQYGPHRYATASAKAVFIKLGGSASGFEDELERRQDRPPFEPPPFKAPENWKGKTVLAEVFTGSGCAPCVATAFAFDALKQTYPAQYLAVLKYHVPIPGADPMMNPATDLRSNFYNIRSAPNVIIDGVKNVSAGGSKAAALNSFNRIKPEIDSFLEAPTDVTIKADAALRGDIVQVNCEFSKVIEGAEYNVVLVQSEEKYKGNNGYIFHKMVVRDIKTVKPSDRANVSFNIPESESATDAYLSEYEIINQRRILNWKWPARQNKIDRSKLKAVVFVQDKETKQVHNAFVTDVIPFSNQN